MKAKQLIPLGLAAAYLVLPFDLIPDAIPLVGTLDDLAALGAAFALATRK